MTTIYPGLILEGYEFMEPIGEGGFASVYKVKSVQFGSYFVGKVAHVKDANVEHAWVAFDGEVQALCRLDHPNIIRLYAHFRYGDNFVMILEYCPNGSLDDYITTRGAMRGPVLIKTLKEICAALRYAWGHGVQHRDIKPANIMFDENGRTKLLDFGISLVGDKQEKIGESTDFRCSPICAAPEILKRQPYDPIKADIWAVGVTLLWMGNGDVPWKMTTRDALIRIVTYGEYNISKSIPKAVTALIRKMLEPNPKHRAFPTEEEISELVGPTEPMKPGLSTQMSFRGSGATRVISVSTASLPRAPSRSGMRRSQLSSTFSMKKLPTVAWKDAQNRRMSEGGDVAESTREDDTNAEISVQALDQNQETDVIQLDGENEELEIPKPGVMTRKPPRRPVKLTFHEDEDT